MYDHLDPVDRRDNLTSAAKVEARIAERLDAARDLTRTGDLAGADRETFEAIEHELDDLKQLRDFYRTAEAVLNGTTGTRESGDGARQDFNINRNPDPWSDLDRATPADFRGRALSAIERSTHGDDDVRQTTTRVIERGDDLAARWATVASSDAYARAFTKLITAPGERGFMTLTPEEREAVQHVEQWRSMSEGSDSAGGYMVPQFLDPAIVLTAGGSVNPFRQIARVVQQSHGKTWSGVSSAGITASWDTEGSEVSDDSPTLSNPTIPIYKAAAFVAGSFEVVQDVSGLVDELSILFADAKDTLEGSTFATGTGTNQPTGIVTALAGTSRETNMATNSSIVVADLERIEAHIASRFRARASWTMNRSYLNAVRDLGTQSLGTQTVDLTIGRPKEILGRPAYEADGMTSGLNASTNNAIVYGDFRSYVVADRLGATLEYVPHMFAPGNGRPSGQRGFYLWWRTGADSVNDAGFVLGVNPHT